MSFGRAKDATMPDGYEFVAIGSGPAGESAAELAAFFGHRSAVIEKARPGGTVTTTGGVPTKTLREAALYFSGLCEGGIYGLRTAAPAEVAIDIIRKRTWEVCGLLQKGTAENIARNHVDYIEGEASLEPDGTVMVAGRDGRERKLRAKTILIATGSRPRRPKNISFESQASAIRIRSCIAGALLETSSLWAAGQSGWSSPRSVMPSGQRSRWPTSEAG